MENKSRYIIGNWKANKRSNEVEKWFKKLGELYNQNVELISKSLKIIICPPLIYIPLAQKLGEHYNLPIKIGAQDVSPFKDGAYTGTVSSTMVVEYAEYVIIGHSERRSYFNEADSLLAEKVNRAEEAGLEIIYCIPSQEAIIPKGINIAAYEPVWAIGTGKTETPENANMVAENIKHKYSVGTLIYGGSVNSQNVKNFLMMESIDGALLGGASLDPLNFWESIINASTI